MLLFNELDPLASRKEAMRVIVGGREVVCFRTHGISGLQQTAFGSATHRSKAITSADAETSGNIQSQPKGKPVRN